MTMTKRKRSLTKPKNDKIYEEFKKKIYYNNKQKI